MHDVIIIVSKRPSIKLIAAMYASRQGLMTHN